MDKGPSAGSRNGLMVFVQLFSSSAPVDLEQGGLVGLDSCECFSGHIVNRQDNAG